MVFGFAAFQPSSTTNTFRQPLHHQEEAHNHENVKAFFGTKLDACTVGVGSEVSESRARSARPSYNGSALLKLRRPTKTMALAAATLLSCGPLLLSQLAIAASASETVTLAGKGFDQWSSRFNWTVINIVPPNFYASDPPMQSCSLGLVELLARAIGVPPEQLNELLSLLGISPEQLDEPLLPTKKHPNKPPEEDAVGLVERGAGGESVGPTAYPGSPRNQDILHKPYRAAENILTSALRLLNTAETPTKGRIVEQLFSGPSGRAPSTDAFLQVPDLVTGLLSSRIVTHILGPALGDFGGHYDGSKLIMDGNSPGINIADAMCRALDISAWNDFNHEWVQCTMISLVAFVMGCSPDTLDCAAEPQRLPNPVTDCDTNVSGVDFSLSIPTLRLLPETEAVDANGNVKETTIATEGFIYYLMVASNFAASTWADPEVYCQDQPTAVELVPGWERLVEIWFNEEGSQIQNLANRSGIPFITLSRSKSERVPDSNPQVMPPATTPANRSCDLLLTQRGTRTAYEWMINFQYPLSAAGWIEGGIGDNEKVEIHSGYNRLISSAGGALLAWMTENVFVECPPEEIVFTISGHSLGGGLSEAWALFFAENVPNLKLIQLISLAPSRSMTAAGMEMLKNNPKVNVRTIVTEYDLIPGFPCNNNEGLPRCQAGRYAMGFGSGQDPSYARHHNVITVSAEELGQLSNGVFNQKQIVNMSSSLLVTSGFLLAKDNTTAAPGPLQMSINHVCAYACYAGKFCFAPSETVSAYCAACDPMVGMFFELKLL